MVLTKRVVAVVGGLLVAGATVARAAVFHLHLEKSEPADKAEIAAAPSELRLWFSEPAEISATRVSLSSGKDTIALGKPTRGKAKDAPLVFSVTRPLHAGPYKVGWRTMGDDGHAVTGTFAFTIKAGAPGR